jgi:hypothetical protein
LQIRPLSQGLLESGPDTYAGKEFGSSLPIDQEDVGPFDGRTRTPDRGGVVPVREVTPVETSDKSEFPDRRFRRDEGSDVNSVHTRSNDIVLGLVFDSAQSTGRGLETERIRRTNVDVVIEINAMLPLIIWEETLALPKIITPSVKC